MSPFERLATLVRPKGLAARAMLFTIVVVTITAVASAAVVLYGAERESARYQLTVTRNLIAHAAHISGNFIADGDIAGMTTMVVQTAQRREIRIFSIRDEHGRVLAEHGGNNAHDIAALNQVAQRVYGTHEISFERTSNGGLALGAPIIDGGRFEGAALMMWDQTAYHFDALPSLAPFLLILACVGLVAIPMTAYYVRRAVNPLGKLARYAEQIGDSGEASAPIEINTGDEFETLANAFNRMMTRLDTSMRQIQEIAFVDPATRLPNQDRFIREVDFAILQRKEAGAGAVAVFELQRLAKLMQTLEPEAVRDVLRTVAERFTAATRTVDRVVRLQGEGAGAAVLARVGVCEFAVFAPGLNSQAEAARYAQHLNAALNQAFDWRGHKLILGAFSGVSLAPRDGKDADTVIRHARMAKEAAQSAPARVKVFTQSLDREAVARLTLEREMRGAIDRNEFRAYFQPKINVATGKIDACEALARWIRPDRTIISPGRFIPVAEETGLISALSDAIMREACWKAAAWARAGYPAKVAVNVSALQFRSDRFADHVKRIVQHAGLAPNQLELEITESVVMEDPDRALKVIKPLRDMGVRLAIDDFGCGHSSLAALSKLPFDVIKIDQQFVRAMESGDSQAAAIVEMILALARTLNMEVVAEGVERREEAEFMAARGCHWIQGFFYGAAVSAPDFAELLRRQAGEDVAAEDAA